jgi:hypothetical protein
LERGAIALNVGIPSGPRVAHGADVMNRKSSSAWAVAALVVFYACGGTRTDGFGPGGSGGSGSSSGSLGGSGSGGSSSGSFGADGGTSGPPPGCTGLQCQIQGCGAGAATTISGTIYDPAAQNPLYDIVAYIPNAPPDPIRPGASCTTCDQLYTGTPIASALTGPDGKFTIVNAPSGTNIPLVIQIGKWRKQLTVPSVAPCTDNALPDRSLTLPKNHSEGDIPAIAISTGGADTLECLLGRIGLDASEYGPGPNTSGRISIFVGDGGADTSPSSPVASASLWDSSADLMKYDIVLLSCEGHETTAMKQQALVDYAAAGGRVFASHFHYAWFNSGPYGAANLATWTPGVNSMHKPSNGVIQTTLTNGQPFPKGQAMQQWLGNVGALGTSGAPAGELFIDQAKHNADVSAANVASTPWIVADQLASPPGATQYFSFDTPLDVPANQQCGRVVFSDLHVGAASGDYGGGIGTVPSGCANNPLSPQEKALEFMLFDLSSCLTQVSQPPQPPPTVQ